MCPDVRSRGQGLGVAAQLVNRDGITAGCPLLYAWTKVPSSRVCAGVLSNRVFFFAEGFVKFAGQVICVRRPFLLIAKAAVRARALEAL